MDLSIIQIDPKYAPHLLDPHLIPEAVQLWQASDPSSLMRDLLPVLRSTARDGLAWHFSVLGSLRPGNVFGVLEGLVQPDARFEFAIPEYVKSIADMPPPFVELTFFGQIDDVAAVMSRPGLDFFGNDLTFAGWLIPAGRRQEYLTRHKFRLGKFEWNAAGVPLSFCSRPNFVAVDFLSPDREMLARVGH